MAERAGLGDELSEGLPVLRRPAVSEEEAPKVAAAVRAAQRRGRSQLSALVEVDVGGAVQGPLRHHADVVSVSIDGSVQGVDLLAAERLPDHQLLAEAASASCGRGR